MRFIALSLFGGSLAVALLLPFLPFLNIPSRAIPAMMVLSALNLLGAYLTMRRFAVV